MPATGPEREQQEGAMANMAEAAADLTRRNVSRIMALEEAEHEKATLGDRVGDAVTHAAGSLMFLGINLLAIAGWMLLNVMLPESKRFDPFPFSLLTLILSIEAILLAIFILITQNRAAQISEKRSHLDLQINLLAEQENTQMLLMLDQIGRAVGAQMDNSRDAAALAERIRPEALSEQLDEAANRDTTARPRER